MKAKTSLLFLLSFVFYLGSSQIPQGFNYQAIARDGSGNPISDPLNVMIAILAADNSTVIYEEQFTGVDPNDDGLFSIVVGTGTRIAGLASFNLIDWTVSPKYIRTKIDYNGEKDLGSTKLYSVPYAMVADSLGGPLKKLSVKGTTSNMEEALFEVKNTAGKTVFAVYNEGVRVYVGDGNAKGSKGGFAVSSMAGAKAEAPNYLYVSRDSIRAYVFDDPLNKGVKGGFAVSGYNDAKKQTNDYLLISPDSVRVFIDPEPSTGKGLKGGFAVGSFGEAKGDMKKLLVISEDSARIYVNETPAKAPKGGFAVGGYDVAKGDPVTFTELTPENYFIGHKSGIYTTGLYNSYLGYETGIVKSTGERNVFIGYHAGMNNTDASYNVFLGNQTGLNNQGNYNTFLGYNAGTENTTGLSNVFIGYTSGEKNTQGNNNVFVGVSTGSLNTTGRENVFVGSLSGYSNTDGKSNVFVGNSSGTQNQSGNSNVYIGNYSGHFNNSGSNNVAIGNLASYQGTTGESNVMLGDSAGFNNTNSYNVFLGKGSGKSNTGTYNTFLGYRAGIKNQNGGSNVFIGNKSGYKNIIGNYNVFLGFETGFNNNDSYNTYIGYEAGRGFTSGQANTFIGYGAGKSITVNGSGSNNVALGYLAGNALTTGSNNVIIGNSAGAAVTTGFENTLIGKQAGSVMTSGNSNVAIGYLAGKGLTTADRNTMVGESSGEKLTTGLTNAFYGTYSGRESTTGQGNTFLGYDCGFSNTIGSFNTYVGFMSGRNALSDSSVFLGYQAGYGESLHQRLYISNGPTGNPLIWGDFRHSLATIHGSLGINTKNPQYSVEAWGTNASIIAHYSGQARGGISALSGARVSLLSTANTDDLVFGYSSTTPMADFSTNFVERMRIDNGTGNIGIANTNPSYKLDVTGNARTTADTHLATLSGNVVIGATSGAQKLTVSGNTYITGDLMIGGNTFDYAPLNVEKWQGACAWFNRRNNDGTILEFAQTGTTVGSISVAAGVVSYNAFTGSHYGLSSETIDEGKLVIMNGNNSWFNDIKGTEVLYGISESSKANDPAAMGAYLGILESSKSYGNSNPYLIMADGNGELWIADNGENLNPGDMLISSDIKGHAMKDRGQYAESYVVAKVAEPVDWNQVTETVNGVKHRKVSVLFTSFVRNNYAGASAEEVEELKIKIAKLETLVKDLLDK